MSMDRGALCLHELFEEQARKTPEETAVADERGELTYEELDRKADRLGAYLRGEGVGPDEVVGVYLERRLEFVVACLAASRRGAPSCRSSWLTHPRSSGTSWTTPNPGSS